MLEEDGKTYSSCNDPEPFLTCTNYEPVVLEVDKELWECKVCGDVQLIILVEGVE